MTASKIKETAWSTITTSRDETALRNGASCHAHLAPSIHTRRNALPSHQIALAFHAFPSCVHTLNCMYITITSIHRGATCMRCILPLVLPPPILDAPPPIFPTTVPCCCSHAASDTFLPPTPSPLPPSPSPLKSSLPLPQPPYRLQVAVQATQISLHSPFGHTPLARKVRREREGRRSGGGSGPTQPSLAAESAGCSLRQRSDLPVRGCDHAPATSPVAGVHTYTHLQDTHTYASESCLSLKSQKRQGICHTASRKAFVARQSTKAHKLSKSRRVRGTLVSLPLVATTSLFCSERRKADPDVASNRQFSLSRN